VKVMGLAFMLLATAAFSAMAGKSSGGNALFLLLRHWRGFRWPGIRQDLATVRSGDEAVRPGGG
jgi:hypothetical protein